jgi:hypothetical protein
MSRKGYPPLPRYACAIDLTCYQPVIAESGDMSYAVVIWFNQRTRFTGVRAS